MMSLKEIPIKQFQTLPSTNDFAVECITQYNQQFGAILALEQTKGRGRRGASWVSNKGELFGSIFYPINLSAESEQWICYLTTLAIVETLTPLLPTNNTIKIKWPNDILVNSCKIGGVLVERITYQQQSFIIIGIGVNILNAPSTDQPTTSIAQCKGMTLQPLELMQRITAQIDEWYTKWQKVGNDILINSINSKLYQLNQSTKIRQGNRHIEGISRGLNHLGELTLQDPDGNIISYNSGITLN